MSEIIDVQTSLTEALRKGRRTARTYVGDKGRDDPVTTVLKACGINSQSQFRAALKRSRTLFDTPETGTADEAIAGRNVSLQLDREFPGWQWVVKIENGLLSFYAREISLVYGVHWSMDNGHPHPLWVRRQAGEMLERYRAPRRLKDVNEYIASATYAYGRGGMHKVFDA